MITLFVIYVICALVGMPADQLDIDNTVFMLCLINDGVWFNTLRNDGK